MSSEFKAYAFAIKDQEIASKYIKTKRQKGNTSNTITNARCRLCKSANKDIIYIIASCPMMSVITHRLNMTLQNLFIILLYIAKISHTENMI